jgi:hypothetical protein
VPHVGRRDERLAEGAAEIPCERPVERHGSGIKSGPLGRHRGLLRR